ncbi:MAG: hypothetical protein RL885_02315, partial [Planctomycetota bacterium]
MPAGAIEDAVQQQLRAVFRTPELVAITCRETKAKEQTERERLERRKGEVLSRVSELNQTFDRLVATGDSSDAITGRIRDLGRQIDEANGELERITGELEVLATQTVSEAEVMAALEWQGPVWDELFPGGRRGSCGSWSRGWRCCPTGRRSVSAATGCGYSERRLQSVWSRAVSTQFDQLPEGQCPMSAKQTPKVELDGAALVITVPMTLRRRRGRK